MVVIGGTALSGGRGTILGTVLGVLILRVMRNGIVLVGVPGLAYNIFIGAIILGMMALHSQLERRQQAGLSMATPDLVRMERVSKSYGRVQALRDVTFTVSEREIVGLLGDNGAGKSTLIKVLSGAVPPTSGEIYIRGKQRRHPQHHRRHRHGIETIYQDSALVTQLSIARNLFLGREPVKGPRLLNRMDKATMNRVAGELLRRVGITKNIPPTTPIASLSGGERQSVAIARAMHFDSDLIVLDEPTNNLGVAETQGVLQLRPQRPRLRPLLHLHRPQHPPRLPGGRPHRRPAPRHGRRRRHRPQAHQHRRRRARHHRHGGAGASGRRSGRGRLNLSARASEILFSWKTC